MAGIHEAEGHIAQGGHHVDAGSPVAHRPAQQLDGVHRAVEVEVLLAREVVEHGHARHPGHPRNFGDRDRVEPAIEEQPRGDLGDPRPRLRAAPLSGPGHSAPHASTTALQWVTGAYAVVFGGLMLAFGALADRFGRRRIMLIGLALLGVASLATAFVATAEQLIAVRVAMGVAAAMTTPGSMALAFRLFADDGLRVRATTLISTVGLVGLAVTALAAALVGWGFARARRAGSPVDGRGEGGREVPLDVGGGRGQRAD